MIDLEVCEKGQILVGRNGLTYRFMGRKEKLGSIYRYAGVGTECNVAHSFTRRGQWYFISDGSPHPRDIAEICPLTDEDREWVMAHTITEVFCGKIE